MRSAEAFESAFKEHYRSLHAYAWSMVKDEMTGEEMVQQVFYKLWKARETTEITQGVAAYLYRSVYNECMNHLKHQKVKSAYQAHAAYTMQHTSNATDTIKLKELETRLDAALRELPEQCRAIFQLSRFEELKYHEIATKLGISVKTVENQMGKALKLLRLSLADFLPAMLVLLLLNI